MTGTEQQMRLGRGLPITLLWAFLFLMTAAPIFVPGTGLEGDVKNLFLLLAGVLLVLLGRFTISVVGKETEPPQRVERFFFAFWKPTVSLSQVNGVGVAPVF